MRPPRLILKGFTVPREEAFRAVYAECEWLVPRWVLEITATAHEEPSPNQLACSCSPEYGLFGLDVYHSFWDGDEMQQRCALRHELKHAHDWELATFAKGLIKYAPKDARPQLRKRLSEIEERSAQEFGFMMEGL